VVVAGGLRINYPNFIIISLLIKKKVDFFRKANLYLDQANVCFVINHSKHHMTTRKSNRGPRADNRIQELLDAAAHLFAQRGYSATSMRNIASSVDMLSGSLYYHFPSKEELLVAVYSAGVTQLVNTASEALKKESDPWSRLETLCRAHLEVVLRDSDYAQVLIRVIPGDIPSVAGQLLELRESYEELFRKVVSDLPLPLGADRKTFRLMLMGSLNWTLFWFDPQGRDSPHVLARKLVGFLKESQNV